MNTKKLLIVLVISILGLNFLNIEFKKNFEKSVIEVIKSHPEEVKTALNSPSNAPEQPAVIIPPAPQPAQPSEEDQFKQQLADKVNVDIGNTPIRGRSDAKIMLVVFSDFQCPFSKRGQDTALALKKKYGDNLMFVYKNLPLPFHPEGMPSAKAAAAAAKQGKFYEYHDKLFENQDKLGEPLYVQIAKDLGLNMQKFNADRNSKEIEDQIKADLAQASSLGFNGTPGFALNGVKILGAYPIDHFEKVISALGLN